MGWSVSRRRKCRTQEPGQASQNVSCGLLQSKDIHQCNGWTSKNVRDLLREVRTKLTDFVSAYAAGNLGKSRGSRRRESGSRRESESERVGVGESRSRRESESERVVESEKSWSRKESGSSERVGE